MNQLPPSGKPKRSLHILCIDDDEQILEMMKACLAHYGHRVKVASGGKRGLELFCTAMLKSIGYGVKIAVNGLEALECLARNRYAAVRRRTPRRGHR